MGTATQIEQLYIFAIARAAVGGSELCRGPSGRSTRIPPPASNPSAGPIGGRPGWLPKHHPESARRISSDEFVVPREHLEDQRVVAAAHHREVGESPSKY